MEMLIIRRVEGNSMLPALRPGQIVVGVLRTGPRTGRLARRWLLRPGRVVVVQHDGLEKLKRIAYVYPNDTKDNTAKMSGKVFVLGDNPAASTDSRHFGWLDAKDVRAVIIWPRRVRITG